MIRRVCGLAALLLLSACAPQMEQLPAPVIVEEPEFRGAGAACERGPARAPVGGDDGIGGTGCDPARSGPGGVKNKNLEPF
jgi:hypothetical protein